MYNWEPTGDDYQMIFLRCRPLTTADLPAALELDHACFGGLWTQAGYQREIDSSHSDLLLLETDSAAAPALNATIGLGCVWAILDEAHITLLGVAPTYRRQGLGQWLLLQLLAHASDRGLTHATLEVRQSNQSAQTLYQTFGFRIAGERRRYYADGENALILWRGGLQEPAFSHFRRTWTQILSEKLNRHNWYIENVSISHT